MIRLHVNKFKVFVCLVAIVGGFSGSIFSPFITYAQTAETDKYTPNPVDCSPEAKIAREALYLSYGFGWYNPCSVGCSEDTTSTVSSLSGANNLEKIWNYLTAPGILSKEYAEEQAAGILGNIQVESGGTYSPTINEFSKNFNDTDNGGYGIVQWTGSRRTNLITSLTKSLPELMEKYYNADYSSSGAYTSISQGFIPKNIKTGELMPVEDNDALLSAQLKFLVDESKSRSLGSPAVKKDFGTSTDKEWEVLKKQTTVKDASNIWVYSFEIPADIDKTAENRATIGETLFSTYSKESSTDGGEVENDSCGSSGTAVHPIADGTRVNEGYGGPRPPGVGSVTCGGITWHNGYDLNSANNVTPVLAAMSGKVVSIDYGRPALNTISIRNQEGFIIRYMHMNNGHIDVKVDDEVTAGQVLGKAGNGNNNYGAHLHVEIDVAGNTNPEVAKLHSNLCGIKSVAPDEFFKIFGVKLCPNGGCNNRTTKL